MNNKWYHNKDNKRLTKGITKGIAKYIAKDIANEDIEDEIITKSYRRITKSYNDDARVIRAEDIITIRIMRVRVVREAIRVRITGVRIIAARYRSLLRRELVSGAVGIAPGTHAHTPFLLLISFNFTTSCY